MTTESAKEIFLYKRNLGKQPELNVWMAYPGNYSFGMSSLGYLYIFEQLDRDNQIFVERIFTDTLKTKTKIQDVHVIGFSMSFELDFIALFQILEKYNIEFKSIERKETDPLIFTGGPVATANPEPFSDFFDFFIIGDGEEANQKVFDILKQNKDLSKEEKLKMLVQIEGIYVPKFTEYDKSKGVVDRQTKKPVCVLKQTKKLDDCISSSILSNQSFFPLTFIIELSRGCSNMCASCLASYLNLPLRNVEYEKIIEKIDYALKYTKKLALLGAMIGSHPKFDEILDYIWEKNRNEKLQIQLQISSLRLDRLTEKNLKILSDLGQKNVTVAIEAASERLRKVINKNITEDQIIKAVELARKSGLKGLKIYCMIGLPSETYQDIEEFIRLAKKIKQIDKTFDITYSFSTFIPKAHTPFQFATRENTKSLEEKFKYLQKNLSVLGVKLRHSSVKWDDVQKILSLGDRSLCDYLVEVYKLGGKLGAYKKAYKTVLEKKLNLNFNEFLQKTFSKADILPYDFIKLNLKKEYLVQEFEKLTSSET